MRWPNDSWELTTAPWTGGISNFFHKNLPAHTSQYSHGKKRMLTGSSCLYPITAICHHGKSCGLTIYFVCVYTKHTNSETHGKKYGSIVPVFVKSNLKRHLKRFQQQKWLMSGLLFFLDIPKKDKWKADFRIGTSHHFNDGIHSYY